MKQDCKSRIRLDKISLQIDWFCREELLDIHKEENEIAIDSKGFEMWKKMSKQVNTVCFTNMERGLISQAE